MEPAIIVWTLIFMGAVGVVYLYVRQDKTHYDAFKEQAALIKAQNQSIQTQMKEIRESNEKLRTQFQDFYKMKQEADNLICHAKGS